MVEIDPSRWISGVHVKEEQDGRLQEDPRGASRETAREAKI